MLHVLDDFFFISKRKENCEYTLNLLRSICEDIGIPIAPEKTVSPNVRLPFLGIDLDTELMMASIPDDKICKFSDIIDEFLVSKLSQSLSEDCNL